MRRSKPNKEHNQHLKDAPRKDEHRALRTTTTRPRCVAQPGLAESAECSCPCCLVLELLTCIGMRVCPLFNRMYTEFMHTTACPVFDAREKERTGDATDLCHKLCFVCLVYGIKRRAAYVLLVCSCCCVVFHTCCQRYNSPHDD